MLSLFERMAIYVPRDLGISKACLIIQEPTNARVVIPTYVEDSEFHSHKTMNGEVSL